MTSKFFLPKSTVGGQEINRGDKNENQGGIDPSASPLAKRLIELKNSFDKHYIFKSLKNLKAYNERLNLKPKQPGYAYITEHLPRELQQHKKRLLPHYQEAKKESKKVIWKINDEQYQLYVDDVRVQIDELEVNLIICINVNSPLSIAFLLS